MNSKADMRRRVIQACMARQQAVADVARSEMDSAQQQSNDYGQNVDRYDSFRTKMMRSRDMHARRLAEAAEGLRVLEALLRQPPHSVADHGAVVITTGLRLFLAIGLGKFAPDDAPDEEYYAVSAAVPLYAAVHGKRVGDTVVIAGRLHTITDIF
ncbi:MAG: hypothetical protein IJV22_05960 [Bacteroidales bacterium]|nr:hypothetical protein [Bacteroidales bacterium]